MRGLVNGWFLFSGSPTPRVTPYRSQYIYATNGTPINGTRLLLDFQEPVFVSSGALLSKSTNASSLLFATDRQLIKTGGTASGTTLPVLKDFFLQIPKELRPLILVRVSDRLLPAWKLATGYSFWSTTTVGTDHDVSSNLVR